MADRHLEPPHIGDWNQEDTKVGDSSRHGECFGDGDEIDAFLAGSGKWDDSNWDALQQKGQEEAQSPSDDNSDHQLRDPVESRAAEDASVEEENAEFDGAEREDLESHEDELCLAVLAIVHGRHGSMKGLTASNT